MIGKIKDQRGYTNEQVLWNEPWINLLMEAADAPRWVKGRKPAQVIETKEQLEAALGKSRLKDDG